MKKVKDYKISIIPSCNFGILCVMNEINIKQRKLVELLLKQLDNNTIEFDY